MSTRREHAREGCLFIAMSATTSPEEIAVINQRIFLLILQPVIDLDQGHDTFAFFFWFYNA